MSQTVDALSTERYLEIERFLVHEADLMDKARYDEWLALLHDDFIYRVPVAFSREDPSLARHDSRLEYANESKSFLTMRFSRVSSDFAWAERPPAFIRHFVTNFRVEPAAGDGEDSWRVATNVLVVRARLPEPPVFGTAERVDRIERHDGRLLLMERTVLLDAEVPNESQLGVIY
jgi:3-phenylpropionate/cinnamic acid dioxygenase small subunit